MRSNKYVDKLIADFAEERRQMNEQFAKERREAAEERRSLADRIQHPTKQQVLPVVDFEPPEEPRDVEELAYIGGIVPDGVTVGTQPQAGDIIL